MDYESFYQDIQGLEKSFKDKLQHVQRGFKNITKDSAAGDIKKLRKNLEEVSAVLSELSEVSGGLQAAADHFDDRAYLESGDFAKHLTDYCKEYGVDIQGESPSYEMFPFRLRIDLENQDLYINRRKIPCMRPMRFVQDMKQQIEKYTKSSFNLGQFANELATAYDLAVTVRNSGKPQPRYEFDVLLKDVYTYLAPTAKARREYDLQQYAFDLSRLFSADEPVAPKDERKFEFGTSKQTNKLIRILDTDGAEHFLGTIRFYK